MSPLVAQTQAEIRMTLKRGESLLLTLGIPVMLLAFFTLVDVLPTTTDDPVDFLAPGVLALAVMSTAMVSLAISTGFERQYGVLKRLGTTPLGRTNLLLAKTAAIVVIELVQVIVLTTVGYALGWRPPLSGLGLAVVGVVLGTAAFSGIGMTMAGRWSAEKTLAGANGLYLLLLLISGMVIPLTKLPDGGPQGGATATKFCPLRHPSRCAHAGHVGARSSMDCAHCVGGGHATAGGEDVSVGVRGRPARAGAMRLSVGLLSVALALSACGSPSGSKSSASDGISAGDGGPDELFAESASFEILAAKPQRVLVGLSTTDGRVLQGGKVDLTFQFADDPASTPEVAATGTFLPVPGSSAAGPEAKIGRPSQGIGVYAAQNVTLPKPGIWTVDVRKAGTKSAVLAQSAVEVVDQPMVPDVGQAAPSTNNPTEKSVVAREILDSRSGPSGLGDALADPVLHQDVVDDLVRDHRPFVVVASTPAYCQSKFCGPVTDLVDTIANEKTHGDVAFVHLEVFEKFDNAAGTRLNPWVIPWIDGNGDGHEPWVFVVDRNGKVAARYDNVIDEAELRAAIKKVSIPS